MKLVIQRVSSASVAVPERQYNASIGAGLMILVGIEKGDGEREVLNLARKAAQLRIFRDGEGKMNLSALDTGGDVLAVSQFTLAGNTDKGRRPSFEGAAPPDLALPLFERFCEALEAEGLRKPARGLFGEHMEVSLVNDGPVTFILESRPLPLRAEG